MRSVEFPGVLYLQTLGRRIKVTCRDPEAVNLLSAAYGQMQVHRFDSSELEYCIGRRGGAFSIVRRGSEPLLASDDGELLFLFEKDLTIELQKLRRDLYFVHAAALGFSGGAFLLAGASGKGKSTAAWALLHHGFTYLSDELAPLDLDRLTVEPYPHALCLKKEPPAPYLLPDRTLRTRSTLHVPTPQLPSSVALAGMPLAALFFLEYRAGASAPSLKRLSRGEAVARLFTHALNPLAHVEDGLAGAAAVAQSVPSFRLESSELTRTCELMKRTMKRLGRVKVARLPVADRSVSHPEL